MNVARIIVLSVAIVAAGIAAFLVSSLLSAREEPAQANQPKVGVPTAQVLVASKDLTIGQAIGSSDLKWQTWPQAALTRAYIVKTKEPKAKQQSIGATVRQPMLAGEPVTDGKIVRSENAGFMAAMLDPGMRAISVGISPETGAGGFILPNDRVDVIMTRRFKDDRGSGQHKFQSETILYDVRVLAIDQRFKEEGDSRVVVGKTATIELYPDQAETLSLAEAMGDISLTLRSLADLEAGREKERSSNKRNTQGAITLLRYGSSSRVPISSQNR